MKNAEQLNMLYSTCAPCGLAKHAVELTLLYIRIVLYKGTCIKEHMALYIRPPVVVTTIEIYSTYALYHLNYLETLPPKDHVLVYSDYVVLVP